jgi:hypothetical protein
MDRVNKNATVLIVILLGPFKPFERKQWKNKP